jgi:hypothetical protein
VCDCECLLPTVIKWIIVFSLDRDGETKVRTRRGTSSGKNETLFKEQEILKALRLTKMQLEDTKVSVAYIEMTEQYYQVILLVVLYEPFD